MSNLLGIAWENIFAGLLGGFLVCIILFIISFVKNRILEKKYPIMGKYLATFEDIENGKTVYTSAPAILKQNGKKAANDRCLYGLWSGYDSENNIVNSGKYTFVPLLENYSVTDAEEEHITQIVAICNKELGEGFLNYKEVMNILQDKNKFICKVALMEKTVLGFCLCRLVEQSEVCEYLQVKQSELPQYVICAEKIGVLKTIAVNSKSHRRGIGYALAFESYNEMVKRNIQAVSSIAWKNGDRINANRVLTSIGLHAHIEIESFWKESSIKEQHNCAACGPPPCQCSAVLYFKPIHRSFA